MHFFDIIRMVIIIVNRKNDYMSFFDVDDDVLVF